MIFRFIITLASLFVIAVQSAVIDKPGFDRFEDISVNVIRYKHELSKEYHLRNGKEFVNQQIKKKRNLKVNVAQNAVLFLGDGMSIPCLAATRIYMGGEEKQLSFEKFPFVGMSKTYCVNKQVADSACTSTAYLSGVKANYGTIGVNAKVPRLHCSASKDELTHTESIAQWAFDAGKSIGLVTTTRVTHASPAGVYAHTAERDWESNADIQASQCKDAAIDDIAQQLIHGPVGKKLSVIFGGGRAQFLNNTEPEGVRTDGKNLIHEWLNSAGPGKNRAYVSDKAGLLSIHPKETNESYLGLFASSHIDFNYKINGISDTIPTLTEMTMKAIEILKTNPKGFFLFVEGGRVDHALHNDQAHIAIDEIAEFSRSVELAINMLSTNDTLFVVTADHAHTLSLSGYSTRGSNIFGVGGRSEIDSKPYLKLSFANGKGYKDYKSNSTNRVDPVKMSVNDFEFISPATVPLESETHGGDDVVIYATGPYSHLFTGSIEQNIIPHYMAYALCIGHGHTACKTRNASP